MSAENLLKKGFEMIEKESGESLAALRHRLRKVSAEFVDVSPGELKVKMTQGKQKSVFVKISAETFTEPVWEKVILRMSREAGWAASLSSGSLPGDFEKVFRVEGQRLLPDSFKAFKFQCSADPDQTPACRHVFLAWLLFLAELEKDPLLILSLRGRKGAELLERLKESQTLKKPGGFPLASPEESIPETGWQGAASWARGLQPHDDLWFEKLPLSGWLWKGQDLKTGLLLLIENARFQASERNKIFSRVKTEEGPRLDGGILPR